MSDPPRQLPLPLPHAVSSARADLIADASNAEALAWLDRPAEWPLHRLALHGPAGTGKSHMLRALAAERGWRLLRGADLTDALALADAPGTALDEADTAPEAALFHLVNSAAETRAPLLLAARAPPARWPVALPDLASRLRATLSVGIAPPSEALCAALFAKHLSDRQLRIAPDVRASCRACRGRPRRSRRRSRRWTPRRSRPAPPSPGPSPPRRSGQCCGRMTIRYHNILPPRPAPPIRARTPAWTR
jgi:hypothetical protein